jgi:hypothetical protein
MGEHIDSDIDRATTQCHSVGFHTFGRSREHGKEIEQNLIRPTEDYPLSDLNLQSIFI